MNVDLNARSGTIAACTKSPEDSGWWASGIRARAERWAEAVFERTRGAQPWPNRGGLIDVHARKAIVDVLHLEAIADRQVAECYALAKAHYEKLVAAKV